MNYPVVKVVDFFSEVGDVLSQVLAVFFALGGLHCLTGGARTELLHLHSSNEME